MAPIPPRRMYVMSLAVLAPERGRGMGAALLREVSDEARSAGLRAVALDVAVGNEAAIRFYRREGFVTVSERRPSGAEDASGLGAIRMERELDAPA